MVKAKKIEMSLHTLHLMIKLSGAQMGEEESDKPYLEIDAFEKMFKSCLSEIYRKLMTASIDVKTVYKIKLTVTQLFALYALLESTDVTDLSDDAFKYEYRCFNLLWIQLCELLNIAPVENPLGQ